MSHSTQGAERARRDATLTGCDPAALDAILASIPGQAGPYLGRRRAA